MNTFYQQITKFLPTKLMIKNKFLCHKVLLCHINFVKFVDQKIIHKNQIIELILTNAKNLTLKKLTETVYLYSKDGTNTLNVDYFVQFY